jgi:hypothetical protein
MGSRRLAICVLLAVFGSMGASYRTANFVVQAPNQQVAEQVGQYAEKWRKEKALEWLGKEMPTWGQACPLKVTVTPGGAGGATTFAFDRGAILSQEMNVQGSLERILNSVLPHEITHTVFAYHFRQPLPRWADEGGSVLSEDDLERRRHDKLVRECLAGGRAFRLRVLFDMKQYPESGQDVMTLYAQGYSLSRFLVEQTDRRQFLAFVGDGMKGGWDNAVRTHYGMNRVEDLEAAWLDWMRGTFKPDAGLLAKNTNPGRPTQAQTTSAQGHPQAGAPVVRGASPDEPRPRYNAQDGWSPAANVPPLPRQETRAPAARLLAPEMEPWTPPARQAANSLPE